MGFGELDLWARVSNSLVDTVPEGWEHLNIGDLVKQISHRVRTEPERLYSMTGVKWYGEGVFLRETVAGKDLSATHVHPLVPGAFIYNRLFAWKGSFAVVPAEMGEQYVSNEFPQFIVDETRISPQYLYLYAMSKPVMDAVNRASSGSAAVSRNRLKEAEFLSIEIPLPPLTTQQAIVHRWQAAQAAAEAAHREAEAVEREAARAFLHSLGLNVPEDVGNRPRAFALRWEEIERWGVEMSWQSRNGPTTHNFPTAKIRELCKMGSGGTPSRAVTAYFGGEIPWVKTTEVRNEVVSVTEEGITEEGLKNSSAKLYPAGSLIVAMYGQGATRGRTAKLGIEAATNQACCVLHDFSPRIWPDFLWFYLMGEYERLRAMASGNNQPNLNAEMIANYEVPLPPLSTQQTLVTALTTARQRAAILRAEAERLQTATTTEVEAAILGKPLVLGAKAAGCDHAATLEIDHDPATTPTPGTAPEDLARDAPGRGQPARGVSPAGAGLHAELDGIGAGAGGAGASGNPAQPAADSTRPLDATRELATAAGSLTYTQVSERLAVNIVRCLDELLDAEPQDVAITPDWLRGIHRRLAGALFPEWGGCFRMTDVQVGTHLPPPAHAVAVQINNFCLDLSERLRHLSGAESIADLFAWVDWRFQWVHPFKDFNGRVGRILLVALAYKLGLPPVDPAADDADKAAYFAALRAADGGDLTPLKEIWLDRLET